jgi:hypothetical protein
MKALLPAFAALLALAGCASNPLIVRRTSCPAVAVVKNASTMTRFSTQGRYDAQDVQLTAMISNIQPSCVERRDGAVTAVRFEILAARRAAAGVQEVQLPYFIMLVKDGQTILAKQIYGTSVRFEENGSNAAVLQTVSVISPLVPLPERPKRSKEEEYDEFAPPPKPATYEVLIGFQLTDAEAAYNVGR